jgi:hypothetical protein
MKPVDSLSFIRVHLCSSVAAVGFAFCASAVAQAPAWQCAPTGSGAVAPALADAARDYLGRVEAVYPHQVLGLVRAGDRYYLLNARDVGWSERMRLHLLALRLRETYLTPQRQEAGASPGSSPPPGDFTCLAASRAEREGLVRRPTGEIVLAAGQSLHLVNPQVPEVAVEVRAAADRPLSMGGILQRSAHTGIYAGLTERAAAAPDGAATLETPDATLIVRTASIGASAVPPREPAPEIAPAPAPEQPVQVAVAPEPATVPAPPAAVAPVVLPASVAVPPAAGYAVPAPYEDYAKAMKTLMALKRSRGVLSVGEMTYVHPAVEVFRRQHP